jgi:dephospho-CoA kinase
MVTEFGEDILMNGKEIDRKKLGAIVFSDPSKMRKLEQIVWPHVQQEIQSRIEQCRKEWEGKSKEDKVPIVVVEAAVLLDAGWHNSFLDAVWVVTVPHHVAVQRITETRGLSVEEAEKRIEAQTFRRGIGNVEDEVKNNVVTATIDNSGSLDELKEALSTKLKDETAWYSGSGI